jgi:hypothetical protein
MNRRAFFSLHSALPGLAWLRPTWIGPEPVYSPLDRVYICDPRDAPKLRKMLEDGEAPLPGIVRARRRRIPMDRWIPLSEMRRRLLP